jgi:hypothetical protein
MDIPTRDEQGFFDSSSRSILEIVPKTGEDFLDWLAQQSDDSVFFPSSTTDNLLAQFFLACLGSDRFQRCHSYCAIIDNQQWEFGHSWPHLVALAENAVGVPPSAVWRPVPIGVVRGIILTTLRFSAGVN